MSPRVLVFAACAQLWALAVALAFVWLGSL